MPSLAQGLISYAEESLQARGVVTEDEEYEAGTMIFIDTVEDLRTLLPASLNLDDDLDAFRLWVEQQKLSDVCEIVDIPTALENEEPIITCYTDFFNETQKLLVGDTGHHKASTTNQICLNDRIDATVLDAQKYNGTSCNKALLRGMQR